METVNISELRQNLQHFVTRAKAGERIGVKVHGKVVVELARARDQQAEAAYYLAQWRKEMEEHGLEIGDVITPLEFDWDDWQENLIPKEIHASKPRKRKP